MPAITKTHRRRAGRPAALLLACSAIAGCGADEAGTAEAVVSSGQAGARVDGLVYQVPLFRQLNPRIPPDRAFYDGPPARDGEGIYAAFVRVCNPGDDRATPTGRLRLQDAFGQRFAPVPQPRNALAYAPAPLAPDDCAPPRGDASVADGEVIAFRVPFASIAERPLVLVVEGRTGSARVALDV